MPFPNEHAARQADPDSFDTFRRGKPKGFPRGISVIFGIKNGKSRIRTIRFDRKLWTVARAREWLKNHGFKSTIEAASKKVKKGFWKGII
jgi:hypothetical protein